MALSIEDVKEAFGCLYDPLELSRTALCRHFPEVAREADSRRRAQAMRAVLMNAVEALQPPSAKLPLTPSLRGYELLSLHYVQRLPLAEAADELNVSVRQAYRDLAQGLEKATQYLSELAERQPRQQQAESVKALRDEVERVSARRAEVDLDDAIHTAVHTLRPLAAAKEVSTIMSIPSRLGKVVSEPSLLRQLLLGALSWAVRHCSGREVIIEGHPHPAHASLRLRFDATCPLASLAGSELEYLCHCLDVQLHLAQERDHAELQLLIPRSGKYSVLVIEDNPAVVEMYRRMLQDTGVYELSAAPAPDASVSLAQSVSPDVIILDILMPGEDGWAVLRSLRSHEATRYIPVLVCSVFDEPELAVSLGAAAFLRKPISGQALVQALETCLSGAARPR